ncbi:MAG: type IX secretion system sortase PorU [Flavobacterium sp.]
MKLRSSILILFFSSLIFSQNNSKIDLQWEYSALSITESESLLIPHFQAVLFFYDAVDQKIYCNHKIKVAKEIDEQSLQILSLKTEPIDISQLSLIDKSKISTNINAKIMASKGRDTYFSVLTFSPIISTSNGFEKVISLEYSYNFSTTSKINRAIQSTNSITNSVLSSGSWYKFYVEKSGVYKLSKSFIEQLGINLTDVNPKNIQIFGHGGKMAPLANNANYNIDIVENAIQVIGEDDNVFNSDDYVLFYAEGTKNWNSESQTHNNLYADKSYYYIRIGNSFGKRILEANQPSGPATSNISTYNGYYFHEVDEINIGRYGRKWFGEQFGIQNSRNFTFNVPNIVNGSSVQTTIAVCAASFGASSFSIVANNQNIGNINLQAIGTQSDSNSFSESTFNTNIVGQNTVNIELNYNNNGLPNGRGYLDYIILRTNENLIGTNTQFSFRNNSVGSQAGIGNYQISNASNISQIWDITDIYNVESYTNASNASTFNYKVNLGAVREYITVVESDYFTPLVENIITVANQNLKGTIFLNANNQFQDVDYLIITTNELALEAERLAQFHRNYSQLNTKVVTVDKIYNEFSSGKQDIAAIRNFIKYVYNNASNEDKKVKFVNLFGHTSFDYKNRIPNNTHVVPTYHALISFSKLFSFMSDDFFGMMDDNEGVLAHNISSATLDIAVGRMLVTNTNNAKDMVNKVLDYHKVESMGRWRNNFILLSDDVDKSSDISLQSSLDDLGDELSAQKPYVNVNKIHLDSYVQESSSGGKRYPQAKEDLMNMLTQGTLVFNYFGHGGESGLSGERIFERSDAENLQNQYRYPLFVTVTCAFSRFDNPYELTAGEMTYTNPTGGAVSMVTTTRLITVFAGGQINIFLSSFLFGYNSDEPITISEALRQAKNAYSSTAYMVFYIGDPALKLALPQPNVKLTKINDVPIENSTEVLSALSLVKLSGEITDENNNLIPDFNGQVAIQLFDKNIQRSTLGNDNVQNSNGLVIMNFQTLGETIFRGNASVTNGLFEISFVVPRDIRIPVGNGKVSFYGNRGLPSLEDRTGSNNQILIGGINENANEDNLPPTVQLYMNDQTFISGGITNESPIFLAYLSDDNGINTANGIGHDIVAILDGDESNPFVLNDFYETNLDDFTTGIVNFPFRNLSIGIHTISFRAWDVYNNLVTSEIQFQVVGNENITLTNVLNYPNPFVSHTQFWFTHNKPLEPLEVQVQIFTVTGKIIKTINQNVTTTGFLSREITWDGKDDFGDKIGKGVYVYKLTVRSTLSNQITHKHEKLVIL